ncbi:heparinase II/III family protein [Paenibacillus doosanensis]|uniref:heparinase II/III domain-containing protein n=1 Tax=Paenibacillus doosanensis TaxID=1229154 RepID=UPI00217F88BF|nr:heparinase II/III family protein [Paenibacillus doosanensis]MCS7458673.1 heparinase II/III family protein [Paenibacillus doosanensis]
MWSKEFFSRVQDKCKRYPQAMNAYEHFRRQAEPALDKPIDIPLSGSGWSHDYNCPNDGDRLVLIDRHHHRCPTCSSVWSGSPWDEVAIANEHWNYGRICRNAALIYAMEGGERWGEWAKRVLLIYARQYDRYPLHDRYGGAGHTSGKVMCQTLSEASWLCLLAQGYHILERQGVFTAEESRMIADQLLLPALDVIANNPAGISNWQTYHNAAKALVAAALGDEEMMRQAVHDPENGFYFQMANSLGEDGFWYEGAWGYHFYTLEAQTLIVLAGESFGLRLYEEPRFQSMFRAPLECMLPDGTLPPIHDSGEVSLTRYAHLYEMANRYFGLGSEIVARGPRESLYSILFGFEEAQGGRNQAEIADDGFVHLQKAGMLFMKRQASSPELGRVATIDYGEHGGWHGHQDKLNLLYYAGGHPWLTDAGMLPYGNSIHFDYFKQTAAHNTVAIGGRSQAEAEGVVEWTRAHPDGTLEAVMAVDGAYPGARLRRKVVLHADVLLDVFHVQCEAEQQVDWIIHTQGRPAAGAGSPEWSPAAEAALGTEDGYAFFRDVRRADSDGSRWSMEWTWDDSGGSGDRLQLIGLAAENAEELYLAETTAMPAVGKRSSLVRRRRGRETVFISIFRAVRGLAEGEPLQADYDSAAQQVRIRIGGGAPIVLSAELGGQ